MVTRKRGRWTRSGRRGLDDPPQAGNAAAQRPEGRNATPSAPSSLSTTNQRRQLLPRQNTLNLLPAPHHGTTTVRTLMRRHDRTHQRRRIKLHSLSHNPNRMTNRRRTHMINTQMSPDPFLVILQVRKQHLPCRDLHVMRHRPRRIDTMNHNTIERRTHVLRHLDHNLSRVPDLQG